MRQTGCIKDMSPALMDENQPAIRRLAARMKHVPANLKVSPAHQWVLTSDAVNDMVACFEVATCVIDRAFLTPVNAHRSKPIFSAGWPTTWQPTRGATPFAWLT